MEDPGWHIGHGPRVWSLTVSCVKRTQWTLPKDSRQWDNSLTYRGVNLSSDPGSTSDVFLII